MTRGYLAAGMAFIAAGATMIAGMLMASDIIVAFAVRALSRDQVASADGEALIGRFWYAAATVLLLLGALLSACTVDARRRALVRWVGYDPLAGSHPVTPRPRRVLMWSSLCGLTVVILYLMHAHLGVKMPFLFKKEALLEDLSFVLYLLSAAACAGAALRIRTQTAVARHRLLGLFYLMCAAAFFIVAGEEISWGQRMLGIETPEALVELNYQQETNVHNFLPKSALDAMTRLVAAVFLIGVFVMWGLAAMLRIPTLHYVVPHPSLVGLVVLVFFGGMVLHLEVFEVLLAMFIAFYSYRVYRIADRQQRGSDVTRPSGSARMHGAA
jgi:hypothetical protein